MLVFLLFSILPTRCTCEVNRLVLVIHIYCKIIPHADAHQGLHTHSIRTLET